MSTGERFIESYALLGDTHTAALIGLDGSIDWLCLPRFDSPACFAALVGDAENGRWLVAPAGPVRTTTRRYRDDSLVLDTTFACDGGTVTVTDAMVPASARLVRSVRASAGRVAMRMEYVVRFDYGSIVPWVRRVDGGLLAVGGPDALLLASDVDLRAEGFRTVAAFEVSAGDDAIEFELAYFASHEDVPALRAARDGIAETQRYWAGKSDAVAYDGPYGAQVRRSLATLHALTYAPTGGIVAAPTTSLPEWPGGVRNWDYRYCWLRDATFALLVLLRAGYTDEATAFRNWLLRAVAGAPHALQIVYTIRGGRRIPEMDVPWLAGFGGAVPVRIGNGAADQFQLDVYGEVIDLFYHAHRTGVALSEDDWSLACAIISEVEHRWREPDRSLWEMRGEPRHFTHSKVMAWVALDRGVLAIEELGLDGPLQRWRATRDAIFTEVCARGYDARRGAFMQSYDSDALDASTLLLPLVGFLPADDPRIRGTVAAIEADLFRDGFVMRYAQSQASAHAAAGSHSAAVADSAAGSHSSAVADPGPDPLPPGEGAFLACSFWLVDNYVLAGRRAEATALFERLLAVANDVGLLAEEYDPIGKRQLGNFPQAFSHVGLLNSAFLLASDARTRSNVTESRVRSSGS